MSTFSTGAGVQDGKLEDGVTTLATEAKRVKEFGFSASEMDRAKKWMAAFYERAYSERDKTESGQFAAEYIRVFLDDEPSPGIEYEYKLVRQLLSQGHDVCCLVRPESDTPAFRAATSESSRQTRRTMRAAPSCSVSVERSTDIPQPAQPGSCVIVRRVRAVSTMAQSTERAPA